MKTKFTLKAFRTAIKDMDRTKVWQLAAIKLNMRKPDWLKVCNLAEEASTSKKMKKLAWSLTFTYTNQEKRAKFDSQIFINRGGYKQYTDSHYRNIALQMLRRLLTEEPSNYTKIPIMGHTNLYFCSPVYGHHDYNKVLTCKIEGNEDFVKKIIDIGERWKKKHLH